MKKLLITLAITTVATTMMAQERSYNDDELKKFIILFFCDSHVPPLEYDENGDEILHPAPSIKNFATAQKISPERMIKFIEEIIRERLPMLQKLTGDKYNISVVEISRAVSLLQTFHGPNSLALLKECVQTKDDLIRQSAIETYILIQEGEGDSVSFLREVNEMNGLYHRYSFCQFLEGIINDLKEKNKNEVVDDYHAFLLDLLFAEQNASNATPLDKLLCKTLDGYPQSVQREQMIQKFLVSENELIRKRYNVIKSEIEQIPADKRTDLNNVKKITLIEQPNLTNNTTQKDETNTSNDETPPKEETGMNDNEASKQPAKSSSNKTILGLAVVVLLAIIGGVVAWRKKS